MTIAELNALYVSAAANMASADWDAAITDLLKMQARLISTPNISRALAGGGNQSIGWNAASIDNLIAECRRNATRATLEATTNTDGPWQTSKVTYKRAT